MKHSAVQPFSEELAVAIAYDTEDAVQQIGRKTLEEWGLTVDEALEIAIDNLRHKAAPQFTEHAPGLYVSQYNDLYDAARILLPELAWQLPLNGNPVAMVPNRICLLLTGDQDEAGIAAMIDAADKVLTEQSRPLGAEMFRLEHKTWRLWRPHGDSGNRLHNIQIQMLAADYKCQQDLSVRQELEKTNEDAFVATFTLAQKEGKPICSYSVLTKGVVTWLPQSKELVAVNDLETKESFLCAVGRLWEDSGPLA